MTEYSAENIAITKTITEGLFGGSDQPTSRDYIRVSSIGDCSRKAGYALAGYEKRSRPLSAFHVTELGNFIHHMIQLGLVNLGLIDAEPYIKTVEVDGIKKYSIEWTGNCEITLASKEHHLVGHTDGIFNAVSIEQGAIVLDAKGNRAILEVKSVGNQPKKNKRTGEMRPGKFDALTKPTDAHIAQASIYADMASSQLGEPVDKIIFVYFPRDFDYPEYTGNDLPPIKCYMVDVDKTNVEMLYAKADKIWNIVKAGELPAREFNCSRAFCSPFCQYCDYHYHCYPEFFSL